MTVRERLISLGAVYVLKTVLQSSCNSSKISSGRRGEGEEEEDTDAK